MASRSSTAEFDLRAQRLARILATGGRRSDCVRFASEQWGVGERQVQNYISRARDLIRADWDIERPQMIADLLSQCSTLQLEARRAQQYHIALGAINTAARLAKLVS